MVKGLLSSIKAIVLAWKKSYFPRLSNIEKLCGLYSRENTVTLDLGCGKTPKNPFKADILFGVDIDYGVNIDEKIFPCRCGFERLPFDDSSIDYVTAFDLIEHIPRADFNQYSESKYPFIFLMNEINRVLKTGGIFLSHTPAYPHFIAFTDPTHVNIITSDTFKVYFSKPYNWALRYGFNGDFTVLHQGWDRSNLVTLLIKG